MKISTLLKREDFEYIFIKSITRFLDDIYKVSHSVKWYPKNSTKKFNKNNQIWYCNPLINSIYVKNFNSSVFESIFGEYSFNPLSRWRTPFQKLYLNLSENKFFSTYFAKYIILISPPLVDSKNKLMIGGNTKIRLIDISSNKVYVILKDGFSINYLEKEIFIRENFKFLSTTKIYNYSKDKLWYCEQYIKGVSPNRMELDKGRKILQKSIKELYLMYKITTKTISLSEYVLSINENIELNLNKLSYLDKDNRSKIQKAVYEITKYLMIDQNIGITVAYCHGDFHQGNIISDENEFWILDWENSGVRQIGYDLLILLIESRIEKDYEKRFLNTFNYDLPKDKINIINQWPGINWHNQDLKNMNFMLFLLEELDFYIYEKSNEVFMKDPMTMELRINTIRNIINSLPIKLG